MFCTQVAPNGKIILKLHREHSSLVGVDFLPDGDGGWVVNEIEDCAGSRMLYATSKLDMTALMVEQIKTELV